MTLVHAPDFVSFSEMPLLRSLTSDQRRPNLLVACTDASIDAVISQLQALCAPPFVTSVLPGPLKLPDQTQGTLLLHDIADLTLEQQLAVYDWMTPRRAGVQIVSATCAPLLSFVEEGRFLEGLFYRLNTVCVLATGDRRAWQRRCDVNEPPSLRGYLR